MSTSLLLDVTSQESIERAASEVEELVQEDGLNCLINNAGINVVANLDTVTADKMLENFHTNSVAPLMLTKVSFLNTWHKINVPALFTAYWLNLSCRPCSRFWSERLWREPVWASTELQSSICPLCWVQWSFTGVNEPTVLNGTLTEHQRSVSPFPLCSSISTLWHLNLSIYVHLHCYRAHLTWSPDVWQST